MEKFVPLVWLSEQNAKDNAASANAIDDNNIMVHHRFRQAVPIQLEGPVACNEMPAVQLLGMDMLRVRSVFACN